MKSHIEKSVKKIACKIILLKFAIISYSLLICSFNAYILYRSYWLKMYLFILILAINILLIIMCIKLIKEQLTNINKLTLKYCNDYFSAMFLVYSILANPQLIIIVDEKYRVYIKREARNIFINDETFKEYILQLCRNFMLIEIKNKYTLCKIQKSTFLSDFIDYEMLIEEI